MYIQYENGINETILTGLIDLGHKVVEDKTTFGFVAATGIARKGNELTPVFDSRRHGSTFVF